MLELKEQISIVVELDWKLNPSFVSLNPSLSCFIFISDVYEH